MEISEERMRERRIEDAQIAIDQIKGLDGMFDQDMLEALPLEALVNLDLELATRCKNEIPEDFNASDENYDEYITLMNQHKQVGMTLCRRTEEGEKVDI